jgi:hypothetical protein
VTIIRYTLWVLLTIAALGTCLLAAIMVQDDAQPLILKAMIVPGLTLMAADLLAVVRLWPWRDHRDSPLSMSVLARLQALLWRLACGTPQFAANERNWAKMHAGLMRDMTAQQRANRIKRRKLAGLRLERRQRRRLELLNSVHVAFIDQLERDHPELIHLIATHQQDRFNALHPPARTNVLPTNPSTP